MCLYTITISSCMCWIQSKVKCALHVFTLHATVFIIQYHHHNGTPSIETIPMHQNFSCVTFTKSIGNLITLFGLKIAIYMSALFQAHDHTIQTNESNFHTFLSTFFSRNELHFSAQFSLFSCMEIHKEKSIYAIDISQSLLLCQCL